MRDTFRKFITVMKKDVNCNFLEVFFATKHLSRSGLRKANQKHFVLQKPLLHKPENWVDSIQVSAFVTSVLIL